METDRILEEQDLPAIVVRIENEDIENLSPYMGNDAPQQPSPHPSMFMFEHNEKGELVAPERFKKSNCSSQIFALQSYAIELLAEHKTGALQLVQELWFEVMRAVNEQDIPGLQYDGSFVLRPNQEETDMIRYGRVLRYSHSVKYDAAFPNNQTKR